MLKHIHLIICFLLVSVMPVLAQADSNVQVDTLLKTTTSWDGQDLPTYPKGDPEVTILKIVIPPHTRLPMHQHPVINAGVLLEGQLTVTKKDGEILHLKEGDAIAEVSNTWHYGRNDSDTNAVVIVFYAGIADEPITIKEKH